MILFKPQNEIQVYLITFQPNVFFFILSTTFDKEMCSLFFWLTIIKLKLRIIYFFFVIVEIIYYLPFFFKKRAIMC